MIKVQENLCSTLGCPWEVVRFDPTTEMVEVLAAFQREKWARNFAKRIQQRNSWLWRVGR
jgi:hypothetical protein